MDTKPVKLNREPFHINWGLRTDNKTFEELKQEHNEFCNRPEIVKIRNHIANKLLKDVDIDFYGLYDPDTKLEQKFDGEKYLGVFDKETGCQIKGGFSGDL